MIEPNELTGDPRRDEILIGLYDVRDLLAISAQSDVLEDSTRHRVRDARDTLAAAIHFVREGF